jgi:DNA-binding transcriptional MerR regulator
MQQDSFSIGYVSQVTVLPQSVLRYWETVFPQFSPYKTPGGTRRYTQEDVDMVLKIKSLLYDQKFTIKGAKTYLDQAEEQQVTMSKTEISLKDYILSELESILLELEAD